MTKNPFSLSFGKEPISLINRSMQTAEIIETFEDENPAYQVCMITGVRGSGKTVMLTEITKKIRSDIGFSSSTISISIMLFLLLIQTL